MPLVSVIIPCYNEQKRIASLLEAIYSQTYPCSEMEVVVADGSSSDGTLARIDEFKNSHPELNILVIENPRRNIPTALNLAIQASRGDIILRIDAHAQPYPDYIERCVESLSIGLGDNVGGIWEILPGDGSWMAASIARAASLPIAVGNASYRHATKPAYVDTVPFGAFKRELFALIGFFDESLLTNEDYEFNTRILESGGRIWLDPGIRCKYFARTTLPELVKQYWRYGYWKGKMLKRYPASIKWRQAIPPLFIMSLILTIITAIIRYDLWFIPICEIAFYCLVLLATSLRIAYMERKPHFLISIPLAVSSMHFSWGLGLLWSMIDRSTSKKVS
jgi:succinoglycan biosynthesis protein ExoA